MSCDLFKLHPPAVGPLNLRTICSLNIKREWGRSCVKQCVKNFKWELRNWEQCFDRWHIFVSFCIER